MEPTDPKSKRILLVDDDQTLLNELSVMFAREGFGVVAMSKGEKALTLLGEDQFDKFDLIILDLIMPGLGGFEVMKELQGPGYQKVPIFILTERPMDKHAIDMVLAEPNVNAFFNKPVKQEVFFNKVHNFLGTKRSMKQSHSASWDEWK